MRFASESWRTAPRSPFCTDALFPKSQGRITFSDARRRSNASINESRESSNGHVSTGPLGAQAIWTGGYSWNQRCYYIEDSFVSRRSHLQRWTKDAQIAPVPLRAVKAHSCGAIITNKDLLLHDGAFMCVSYAHPFFASRDCNMLRSWYIPNAIFPERDGNFFSLDRVCGGVNRFSGRSD